MDSNKVNSIIMSLKDSLPAEKIILVKDKLEKADDSVFDVIICMDIKSPTTTLLFSIFLGGFGVDRFYIGDTGLGVAKLLLGWATCGIWPLIDIFLSYKQCKEKNLLQLMSLIE